MKHLTLVSKALQGREDEFKDTTYFIPRLWSESIGKKSNQKLVKVNPIQYFLEAVHFIEQTPKQKISTPKSYNWTRDAVIYNIFIRTTCAFDHNQNGKLDLPVNTDGWRETGTFLKAIALLPYIKSLGANTIHFLPITSIGTDGNKGTLGSLYAIKNPYELDPNQSEPNLGVGVEEEFKALVEAAHHLGIRVVVEFVFRTSARDGDWVKEHPEWFYWIKESVEDRKPHDHDAHHYGAPIFTHDELQRIKHAVEEKRFDQLIPPHEVYREMFTTPPKKNSIMKENGKYIGVLGDGTRVRIPGAFADWPPDDNQPPWGDVTYLKMYDHPDFNYIAYNTIRMYDAHLAKPEHINKPLWDKIAGIIPHYQKSFGIDGVMIDMGHALPMELKLEIIRRAREIDPDFAFWDENFSVTEKSVQEGYNAVIGYCWSDQHHPEKFKRLVHRFATEGYPVLFFATPESHNTPRAAARDGGGKYSTYAWAINNFLPAIPFIHSGFELSETYPINTGLDFTKEELKKYPSDKLPLFSEYAYDWTNDNEFTEWVKIISQIRGKHHEIITNNDRNSFHWVETHHHHGIAFIRSSSITSQRLLVAANSDMHNEIHLSLHIDTLHPKIKDLLSEKEFPVSHHKLDIKLHSGQVMVFEI
jgi:hypothetical protein